MKGYSTRLEEATRKNSYFRRVLYTGKPSQLIPMSLGPGEEIGEETHRTVDQFLRETGEGTVVIDGKSHRVKDGEGVVVPAGARHNVINTSKNSKPRL
jgi:mannose-6-phosphate isomerase-like protein (cupin superfamily)